jgi:hypothetical protein
LEVTTVSETLAVDVGPKIDPFWYEMECDCAAEEEPELLYCRLITDGWTAVRIMELIIRWVLLWSCLPEGRQLWKTAHGMARRWDPAELDDRVFAELRRRVEYMKRQALADGHEYPEVLDRAAVFLRVLEAAAHDAHEHHLYADQKRSR